MNLNFALKTSSALQIYQVMRQLAAIAISIGLAKSSLGLAQIGSWEQLLFIGTTCTFFWVNGLLHAMLPIYPNLSENGRKSLIFNTFAIFNLLAAALFAFFFLEKIGSCQRSLGSQNCPILRCLSLGSASVCRAFRSNIFFC